MSDKSNRVKYRLIAIDLDGTLLSPLGEVTPRTKAAVHGALKAGLLVCFATGRNWTESKTVLDAVEHYSTAVFVGGAVVVDTDRKVTLHRTLMDGDLAAELCRELEAIGMGALALQDSTASDVDYLVTDGVKLNPSTVRWLTKMTNSSWRASKDLGSKRHEHTIRVGIDLRSEQVAMIRKMLDAKFGSRIYYHSIRVPAHNVEVLEIFDPSVNKWQGILHLAAHHGIEPRQIIAIGDDVNDLAMIENAGLGVAMGNATPPVKAIADRVIGSHADDGLAKFLEELVEQHIVEPEAA